MKRDHTCTVSAVSLELPIAILDYVHECLDAAIDNNLLARDALIDVAIVFGKAMDELKQLHADATYGATL